MSGHNSKREESVSCFSWMLGVVFDELAQEQEGRQQVLVHIEVRVSV